MRQSALLLAVTTAVTLLIALSQPLRTITAAADPPDTLLYLPQIMRQAGPPLPPPVTPTPPAVTTHTLTISSYDLEAGFIPTAPGDFVYPYPRLNHDWVFQRPKLQRTFTAVTLQNSYVAITVLPELGGRLYGWQDRVNGRQLLYQNPVLKPTQWGWRGWWLATGGIEWAFPTDEHGLNEWRPWAHTVTTTPDSAAITVWDIESQTGMTAGVTLTLHTDYSYITMQPFVQNDTPAAHSYQYWLNAMLALNGNHVSAQTEFIAPAAEAVVHSTGDPALPGEHSVISWPVYNGRALNDYRTWTNYFGFFVPHPQHGFTGIYDHNVGQGVLRVFDPAVVPGHKFFGPADLSPHLWTDDGSGYVELWSSGVTPDFWTYVNIAPGGRKDWTERWYALRQMPGVSMANEHGALYLAQANGEVRVAVAVTAVTQGTAVLLVNGQPAQSWPLHLGPEQVFEKVWKRPSGLSGPLTLRLLDASGHTLIETP